jgi:hypothetical protein
MATNRIVLKFPDAQTPGYLRFMQARAQLQATAAELAQVLKDGGLLTVEQINAMVDLLIVFVVEPADKEQARELILDATADDLTALLQALVKDL